jgi:hypothetical protein
LPPPPAADRTFSAGDHPEGEKEKAPPATQKTGFIPLVRNSNPAILRSIRALLSRAGGMGRESAKIDVLEARPSTGAKPAARVTVGEDVDHGPAGANRRVE